MHPVPPSRRSLVCCAPVLIWRASSGAPPQAPEFSALVPGWPCEHEASSPRLRRVQCKFREGYPDRRRWPRVSGTIRPRCHPAPRPATEGPITIASLHGGLDLTKKTSGGGENREPSQARLLGFQRPGGHGWNKCGSISRKEGRLWALAASSSENWLRVCDR